MRTDPVKDDVPPIEFESLVSPCLLAVSVPIPSSPELLSLSLLPPEFYSGKKFLVNWPKPSYLVLLNTVSSSRKYYNSALLIGSL